MDSQQVIKSLQRIENELMDFNSDPYLPKPLQLTHIGIVNQVRALIDDIFNSEPISRPAVEDLPRPPLGER